MGEELATRLIVGLGNPGGPYAQTRHNIGVRVLERAAARWSIPLSSSDVVRQGSGRLKTIDVTVAAPVTWMNQSGPAVKALLDALGLFPSDLIVIHDDLDLPLGRLRIKRRGGAGGHNGILSILTALETNEFCRLKIGIGRPAPGLDAAEYVLSPPSSIPEAFAVEAAMDRAVDALECLVMNGLDAAMNRFNVRTDAEVIDDE